MVFALVIARRPVSADSGGKAKFKAALSAEAARRVAASPLFTGGALYARIVWFHAYATRHDVDNIAKRILDSLDGVVYSSDFLVAKCAVEKGIIRLWTTI